MNPQRLHAIMSGQDRSLGARLARLGLSCAEPFYRLGVGVRNKMFDLGIRKPKKLPRPVISVGNITTGGTGKTPMVIHIVQKLISLGEKPAVLMRGYMGTRTGAESDEAELIRASVSGEVPVMANPDRAASADAVLMRCPETTVFVLDDGFQHRQVHRDVDIALVDATNPFGFGRMLPRGLLRETKGALQRATHVIVTRADLAEPGELIRIDQAIRSSCSHLFHAVFEWGNWIDHVGQVWPIDHLRSAGVAGICGIGNPAAFERDLRRHVGLVAHMRVFPDHHVFTQTDFEATVDALSGRAGVDAIVVTEKDWTKLRHFVSATPRSIPILRPKLITKLLHGDLVGHELTPWNPNPTDAVLIGESK